MSDEKYIAFLRGTDATVVIGDHPILELSEDEMRVVIGGVDGSINAASTKTGSYDSTASGCSFYCCDGVKKCCNGYYETE